jgi:hypothetical protein
MVGGGSGFKYPSAVFMRTMFTAEHLAAPLASFVHSFPAMTNDQPGTAHYMTYAARYCLVPHPMAVLGRKRM